MNCLSMINTREQKSLYIYTNSLPAVAVLALPLNIGLKHCYEALPRAVTSTELSLAPHNRVALLLDGSFISCHLPLLAGGELLGVWLGEDGADLGGCSSTRESTSCCFSERTAFMSRTVTAPQKKLDASSVCEVSQPYFCIYYTTLNHRR